MITVLTIGYIGCVIFAFKVAKIKVSALSITLATLTGVSLMAGILTVWKFSAPMTDQMTLVRKVANLIADPETKGLISKVYAQEAQLIKMGDPLWEVEPRPNQYALNKATAQVAVAEQGILNAQAAVEVAAARVEVAEANQALAGAQLETALKVQEADPAAVAELKVEVAQQNYQAYGAAVETAVANKKESELALVTARDNLRTSQAQLELAKVNLSQNVKRAPSDGYLINFQTTEGTMTTSMAVQSQGLFLNTSVPGVVAAVYPQNFVKNVEPGNLVEIAFKSRPGQIATGKVDAVLKWTGEGQLAASNTSLLPILKTLKSEGFLVVRITIDDSELEKKLPLGAAGSVAIYTDSLKPFHIFSQITIRIKKWMNYLPI